MKSSVERLLNDVRAELRTIPSVYKVAKTPADRQKLLVSTTQDVCD